MDMSKNQVLQRDTDILDKLDNIYTKADQIDSLVNDLFSATMEDLGEFKVNCSDKESTILSEIIKKNDSKGLVTETELPKIIINIDDKRMSQVIGNIISNSYKYAGTRIDVDYGITDKYLKMVIKDYGPGVSRDELELITNKFYRGRNAQSDNKDGSGLGLYIAKSLMIKMNGELICDSDEEGFSVTLMIPIS
jgi:signal transduction histidine kinase